MLRQSNPEAGKACCSAEAQQDVAERWKRYEALAQESPLPPPPKPPRQLPQREVSNDRSIYTSISDSSCAIRSSSPPRLCARRSRTCARWRTAGASAIVLHSLFEEQINIESNELDRFLWDGSDVSAESTTIFPDLANYNIGPDAYLEHIRQAKQSVSIPVIASLNGVSRGGWVSYAREMQQAGADAIELNVYFIPADPALQLRTRSKSSISTWSRKSATPSPFRSR